MEKFIEKLKDNYLRNNEKKILKNYYSKEIRKGRSYRAASMDKFLSFLIIFTSLTLLLTLKSNNFLLSLYMSIIIAFFIINMIIFLSKSRKAKKIKLINEELKSKKVLREISHLNKEGFVNYIKLLLDEYYDIEFEYSKMPLDLIGTINGESYGIKCIKTTMEDRVTLKDLDIFMREIKNLDLDEGILITNSYFREEVVKESKIMLFDFDKIKEILITIDRYPTEEEITSYIIDRYIDRRNNLKGQIKTIDKKKIIQLYGIFIVFYSISFIVNYSLYYKMVAILVFVIATVLGGYKLTEYVRLNRKHPFT